MAAVQPRSPGLVARVLLSERLQAGLEILFCLCLGVLLVNAVAAGELIGSVVPLLLLVLTGVLARRRRTRKMRLPPGQSLSSTSLPSSNL